MNSLSLLRVPLVVIAGLLLLSSCGSSEDSTAAPTTSVATQTPVAAPTPVDDRTELEISVDKLDLMMIQLGISELEDLEDATSCVIDRLESENRDFTGQGTADLIALSACNDTVISRW